MLSASINVINTGGRDVFMASPKGRNDAWPRDRGHNPTYHALYGRQTPSPRLLRLWKLARSDATCGSPSWASVGMGSMALRRN